jgi:uncharacterized protein
VRRPPSGACGAVILAALASCAPAGPGTLAIHAIQGASHRSPHAGEAVSTRGIVTATRSNGFYLQDPAPDADEATSEAIFVFTGAAPAVAEGDEVTASGPVVEFQPGCTPSCPPGDSAHDNLTTTELDRPTLRIHSQENPLPPPVVVGLGGRRAPARVIEDHVPGDVQAPGNRFDPGREAIDFYESLEGMRVQIHDAVAVGPARPVSGGPVEVAVVGDGGALAGPRTARGGVVVGPADFHPERLIVAGTGASAAALRKANVGDSWPGAIVGVLDYGFGNFKLLPTAPLPAPTPGGLTRETLALPPPGPADLHIAAFNVQNLDPRDPAAKVAELAGIVVHNLGSPDILALEEIQDNDGARSSGVVDASLTFQTFIAAIAAAGGPRYRWTNVDPVDGQDGGEPGGNIRVGFLFRADRGLTLVDRPGAGPLTPNAVTSSAGVAALAYSPGRIDPANAAFTSSRKPLAAEFRFQGATLFAVANHFNSRVGDQPLFGRFQPPAPGSATQRTAQARVLAAFVEQLLEVDSRADIVVLGDLNDFEFSAPLAVLERADLTALIRTLPPAERYTYVFEGNAQALDHVLVSPHLMPRVAGFDVVHVNAEFAAQASDHDPGVVSLSMGPSPGQSWR